MSSFFFLAVSIRKNMKDFIIFIREDISQMAQLSEEEFQTEIQDYTKWVEEMAKTGNYVSGDPLVPEGRYILSDKVQSDGPFIESKEAISGYVIIKATDIDQAVGLAQKCPVFKFGGVLELRPIMKT